LTSQKPQNNLIQAKNNLSTLLITKDMDNTDKKKYKLRAMSKLELANAYNVSSKTFASWIKQFKGDIGKYLGRAYTPKQVRKIFELLGHPF
jgi:hypothetical protein